jgi:hypothetical protein
MTPHNARMLGDTCTATGVMTGAFELEVEVPGTPEEVWDAIAAGPGCPGITAPPSTDRPRSAPFRAPEIIGLVGLAHERLRGTHPPRIGHELPQPFDVHLRQPQHHQRPAVLAGRGEEELRLAQEQSLLLRLIADEQHRDVRSG